MLRKKWFWVLAYAAPFIFYVIPMLRFTPEWKDNRFIIYWILLILSISIYTFLIFHLWLSQRDASRSKKLAVSIITPVVIAIHCILVLLTDFQYHFSLGSETVQYTDDISGRRIYIIENLGLFNIHFNCEIGYKNKYLPLYHTHYSTSNHIKFNNRDQSKVTFTEYEYVDIKREVKDLYDLLKKTEKEERPIRHFTIDIDNIN